MRVRCLLVLVAVMLGLTPVLASRAAAPAVLYRASWASGFSGWQHAGSGWSARSGVLTYNGSGATALLAPYRVTRTRFSVEASLRVTGWKQTGLSESYSVGLLLRASRAVDPSQRPAGLVAGLGRGFIGCDGTASQAVIATADTAFNPVKQDARQLHAGHAWHLYRVAVNGNTITLSIDGRVRVTATTKQFAAGQFVGLFSLSGAMQVRSFQIMPG